MNSTFGFHLLAISTLWLMAQPVLAADGPKGNRHDNSGRQIASVVPIIPHREPGAVGKHKANGAQERLVKPAAGDSDEPEGARMHSAPISQAPTELSPEVKEALEQGAIAAEGISKIAVKRVSDVGVWIATVWRELNEMPQATPNSTVLIPEPPPGVMKPLVEPSKHPSQLWYTNENRMRTVVGR